MTVLTPNVATIALKHHLPLLDDIIATENKLTFQSDEAPRNGFYLMGDAIRMRYTEAWFFNGKEGVELWFHKLHPKISFSAENVDMLQLPRSPLCGYVSVHIGSSYSFSNTDTVGFHRFEAPDDPTWEHAYSLGTQLLRKAAKKYDLKKHYRAYRILEGKPLSIGEKVLSFLSR